MSLQCAYFGEFNKRTANFVNVIMLGISCLRPVALCNKNHVYARYSF